MISEITCKNIYSYLVQECKAHETLMSDFVHHVSSRKTGEYRFQGSLGFGGKFYWGDSWRVSAYTEDMTNDLRSLIERVNKELSRMENQ